MIIIIIIISWINHWKTEFSFKSIAQDNTQTLPDHVHTVHTTIQQNVAGVGSVSFGKNTTPTAGDWVHNPSMTKAFIQATCKIGHRSFTRTRWFTESQPKGFTPWKLREPCGTQTLGSCQQAWQFELIWSNHLRVPHLFGNSMWVCLNGRTPQFIRHRRKVHLQWSLCTSLTQNIKNHRTPGLALLFNHFPSALNQNQKGVGQN